MSDRKTDLRKSLKSLYDDLRDAENGPDRNTFGFKQRLKVIHENLQDLEPRLYAEFPHLGDFSVIGDFEPAYYRLGDSGMDQLLKSKIKRLAIEIDANLEQDHTTTETTTPLQTKTSKKENDGNPIETLVKHNWTRGEKIGIVFSSLLDILYYCDPFVITFYLDTTFLSRCFSIQRHVRIQNSTDSNLFTYMRLSVTK